MIYIYFCLYRWSYYIIRMLKHRDLNTCSVMCFKDFGLQNPKLCENPMSPMKERVVLIEAALDKACGIPKKSSIK